MAFLLVGIATNNPHVFAMVAIVLPPIPMGALFHTSLIPGTKHLVQPDRTCTGPKVPVFLDLSSPLIAQLTANHFRCVLVEIVVANATPGTMVFYLNPSPALRTTITQSQISGGLIDLF